MKVEEPITIRFDEANNSTKECDSVNENELDIITKEVIASPLKNQMDENEVDIVTKEVSTSPSENQKDERSIFELEQRQENINIDLQETFQQKFKHKLSFFFCFFFSRRKVCMHVWP